MVIGVMCTEVCKQNFYVSLFYLLFFLMMKKKHGWLIIFTNSSGVLAFVNFACLCISLALVYSLYIRKKVIYIVRYVDLFYFFILNIAVTSYIRIQICVQHAFLLPQKMTTTTTTQKIRPHAQAVKMSSYINL